MSTSPSSLTVRAAPLPSREELEAWQQRFAGAKVLCVGEAILDEYAYCDVLGRSSKEPILAVTEQRREVFAGGILAVARHAIRLGATTRVVSRIGDDDRQTDLIAEALDGAAQTALHRQAGAPTLVKRRYLDSYYRQKLFEVYEMEGHLSADDEAAVQEALAAAVDGVDAVVCVDFGHGLLTDPIATSLVESSPYLSVNVQTNAASRGYCSFKRFSGASHLSLTEGELRLEFRKREAPIEELLLALLEQQPFERVTLTRGVHGCVVWEPGSDALSFPSLAGEVVDRIGAGDAFLTVAGPLSALGAPVPVTGFLASAVAAAAVGIVGNRRAVTLDDVNRILEHHLPV